MPRASLSTSNMVMPFAEKTKWYIDASVDVIVAQGLEMGGLPLDASEVSMEGQMSNL